MSGITPEQVFAQIAIRSANASARHTQERSRWVAAGTAAAIALVASHMIDLVSYLNTTSLKIGLILAMLSLVVCLIQEMVSMTVPPEVTPDPSLSKIDGIDWSKVNALIGRSPIPWYMRPGWNSANEGGRFHPEYLANLLLAKHHRLRELYVAQAILVTFAIIALGVAAILN